jgi:hypothetical protein
MAHEGAASMRSHSRFFRLTASTAIAGLAFATALPQAGFAQSPLPPLPGAQAEAPQTTADPPTRVGRLAAVTGQVSFHGTGAEHWDAASVNYPVTSGDAFWTQPGASADIGVSNDRVTMDQSTELDISTLDDNSLAAIVAQGQIFLRLAALAPGETYTVTTPRGVVGITAPGRYEIAAGDVQTPTRITVVEGAAQVSGGNAGGSGAIAVAANQTLRISGKDQFDPQLGPAQHDAFLTAQLARERPQMAAGAVAAPAEVQQMTGGSDLYEYGTWTQTPDYGDVWYPQAAAAYVPYRDGRWAFVQPWGWTWIDAAPWGFAPFHYGRWVQVGGRWGWAPGGGVAVGSPGYYRPVYAPALVTFFGIGAGIAAGYALAGGFGGNVGWCPLGWQEPFRPWYRASPNYIRNVNVTSVRDLNRISTVNNVRIDNFANRGGATMVSARAFALSQPIGHEARPFEAAQFADARPLAGRDLTARPPLMGVGSRAAPGPAIRAYANAPIARPGLEPNGRLPMTTGHAPGPPIEPRGGLLTPNGAPGLRPPVEAGRPDFRAPGGPMQVRPTEARPMEGRPGALPQNDVRALPRVYTPGPPPPRVVEQGRPAELPRVVQPVHPYEPPHVVQQFRPAEPPHVVQEFRPAEPPHFAQQAHPAPPPPHPAPPPPPHGIERKQPT